MILLYQKLNVTFLQYNTLKIYMSKIFFVYYFQIVFKSGKTGKCTRFSVDLSSRGTVSCLNQAPHPDKDDMVRMPKELPQRDVRSLEEIRSAPRSIDTDGYK